MVFKKNKLHSLKKKVTPEEERPKVLLIDDEEPNLKILNVILGSTYNLMQALSAEEALNLIEAMENPEEISLIICDQRMSGMTGVSFFEKISAKIPKTKRVLLTGFLDMDALISSINEAHIYKFLMKPYNRTEMMLSVKRAVEAYDMEIQIDDHVKNLEAKVQERTRQLEEKNRALEVANQALENASLTDPLTGLKNRRFLLKNLDADIAVVRRSLRDWEEGTPRPERTDLLFFLMDLDHFKSVNDTYGHAAGDRVLVQVRELLERVFRESDFLVRWGGEEFLIIGRFVHRDQAALLAERIRETVASHAFDLGDGRTVNRTCSVGFACFPFHLSEPGLLNWSQIVDVADACLYAAKHSGRDAWVGLLTNKKTPTENLFQRLQDVPDDLIKAGEVDLKTSLQGQLYWKRSTED